MTDVAADQLCARYSEREIAEEIVRRHHDGVVVSPDALAYCLDLVEANS